MREVALTDSAFEAFHRRAQSLGLSVDEYLNRSAAEIEDDGFSLTPEVREAIERGLKDASQGRTASLGYVRERLAQYKARWREENER
jgi:hypothetical protein